MKRWSTLVALGLVLWASAFGSTPAEAAGGLRDPDAYMPLSQLQRGMRGVFKTVVEGTRVESFEVEVLGVLPNTGPTGDLIMIEASDTMMERTGGIASGMSGSPVFVDGRLIGALGFALTFSDHRIGLLTPIERMAELYSLLEPDEPDLPHLETHIAQVPEEPEAAGIVALTTPVLASGLSQRAFEKLNAELESLGLGPVRMSAGAVKGSAGGGAGAKGGALPPDAEEWTLEPGAAFGIQLVRGDVDIAAIGTVTHVDGERFIALAHPFMNRGETAFLASGAYVHHIFQTLISPFKMASPLEPVGSIVQDRGAGVAGRVGESVPVTRVTVKVWDADRRKESTYEAEVVQDEALLVPLISAVVFSAADRALDRVGRGTARVSYRIEGEGMPMPFMRTNVAFSDFDAAGAGLAEVLASVGTIVSNPFEDVKITEVNVALDVEKERHIASIEAARPLPRRVRPGDTVEVDVTLRPFRRATVRERVTVKVPDDALPGPVGVVVRAGGWAVEHGEDHTDGTTHTDEKADDLRRLLERMMKQERNNELIVEFYPRRQSQNHGESHGPTWDGMAEEGTSADPDEREVWREGPGEPTPHEPDGYGGGSSWQGFDSARRVFESRPTPYVLTGSVDFELEIAERDAPWLPPDPPVLSPL